MAYTHSKKLLLATSISLALSGCGGGGGGAAPGGGGGNFLNNPVERAMNAEVEEDLERIRTSVPQKGSVSQSTNIDTNNGSVTRDAFNVDISEDSENFVYTIEYDENADGTPEETIRINTANPGVDVEFCPNPEHCLGNAQELIIGAERGKPFNDGRILILAGANYEGDADYIAAGLWVYVPDNFNTDEFALGAFADGKTEFTDIAGESGTATYKGDAIGLVSIYSPSLGLQLRDFTTGDDADADSVVLNAIFGGTPSISGTITNIREGIRDNSGDSLTGTIMLESTSIGSDGFFKGSLGGTIQEVELEGNWGGQFYGIDGPERVIGTLGGGGSGQGVDVNFVGAYIAERESE